MQRKLKVGDTVKTVKGWNPFSKKDLTGMKLVKCWDDNEYVVVDNVSDIGDGVIGLDQIELDVDWYRKRKLKRILK